MPTIKDVAKEAGVSIATVSYVLNNKDRFVGEDTRRQVLEAIERVGYTPNITARNLKSNQTKLIGYAWHEVPYGQVNTVLDGFIYFLARAVETAGYHLLTFTHPVDDPLPVYDELIRTQRVDAFVLSATIVNDARIRFLLDSKFPFVSFGRSNSSWDFHWVDTDGQRGIREAVNYLIALGHERIAMAAWPEESISGNDRLAGYVEAMHNAGLPIHPDYILRGEHSEEAGHSALSHWMELAENERPTAVVAISDRVAIGAMSEAEQRGLTVGRDLSIIGFDDVPLVQYIHPGLTTLQQPIPEICQALVMMLEKIIGGENDLRNEMIPPKLVIRNSCGAPR
jgi:DNA-binding LacI/PurR family transcriptional regulator